MGLKVHFGQQKFIEESKIGKRSSWLFAPKNLLESIAGTTVPRLVNQWVSHPDGKSVKIAHTKETKEADDQSSFRDGSPRKYIFIELDTNYKVNVIGCAVKSFLQLVELRVNCKYIDFIIDLCERSAHYIHVVEELARGKRNGKGFLDLY